MSGAKNIRLTPIAAKDAHRFIRAHHYSGKTTLNSQLHFGIFLGAALIGAMQFGPSLDKSKLIGLVANTGWNGFIELNRLALIDDTPRNAESRALAIAMRLIKQQYPHIGWVVSFADATQCGDGTIYRASGFILTGLRPNTDLWIGPSECPSNLPNWLRQPYQAFIHRHGRIFHNMTSQGGERHSVEQRNLKAAYYRYNNGSVSSQVFKDLGCQQLDGFQLRYIYFLDPTARQRLTVPEIPFSEITTTGANMYLGKRPKDSSEPPASHAGEGGAAPTRTLQNLFPFRDRMSRLVTG